jgi:hypothetical protein
VLLCSALLLFSCSKNSDDSPAEENLGNSTLTMKVNGEQWDSTMSLLITEEQESSQQGKYRYVSLTGNRIIDKNSATEDDLVETIGLYIAIPESKFKNPKGNYPIILKESQAGYAWGVFGSSTDLRDATTYVSGDPNNSEQSVGSVEIINFKIGEQMIFGHPTGQEGYKQLSGTFHLDVYPMNGTGNKLKITDGKFNISEGFDFGF